jgi:hypothetical protein
MIIFPVNCGIAVVCRIHPLHRPAAKFERICGEAEKEKRYKDNLFLLEN